MTMHRISYLRLLLVIVLMFVLTVVALPLQINAFRPLWILLIVLYVQVTFPRFFHVTWVFMIGLIFDVLCSSVMGQHAFALSIATWCISRRTGRFKFFTMLQQIAWVVVLCTVYQMALFLSDFLLGFHVTLSTMLCPILVTACLWPLLKQTMDRLFLLSPRHRRV